MLMQLGSIRGKRVTLKLILKSVKWKLIDEQSYLNTDLVFDDNIVMKLSSQHIYIYNHPPWEIGLHLFAFAVDSIWYQFGDGG